LEHLIYIVFLFAIGACVGSFLNVVVWRLPRGESIVSPPSHCPKCGRNLKWYDNLPVIGWLKLRGKCRFCGQPISARYPIVEAVTGALFAGYYVAFFMFGVGPCPNPGVARGGWGAGFLNISQHWPVYALYMLLLCVLLASSLIDAELYIIPLELLWFIAVVGLVVHAIIDTPRTPGTLNTSTVGAALAAAGGIGLLISLGLLRMKWIKHSFADGGPLMEIDREAYEREVEAAKREGRAPEYEAPEYTPAQIRAEVRHEMLFLLPPLALAGLFAALVLGVDAVGRTWGSIVSHYWVSGLLGAVLGGLIGGFVVWLTRILGTLAFGREAMGMGDVHLMAAVGAVVGAGAATVAFFLAPFFGLVLAIYLLATGNKRELPYGPYLSLATAFVMLLYCPIAAWLSPGMAGLRFYIGRTFGIETGT
jgi:leader peptidase (prepilin peptidase) / N-methyltransferase